MSRKDKLKLFLFIHDLAPYGAQRVVFNIARRLEKSAVFHVTVCSFWGDETFAPELAAGGAEVVLLKARRFLDLRAWLRLAKVLFRLRPDIVQTNMPELSVPVRLLALFLPGLRVVHTVMNPLSSEPFYWRFLNRLTFFLCAGVVFCSEELLAADPCSRRAGGKVSVIQNAMSVQEVPATARAALRGELGIADGEKVISFVARLSVQKAQDVLLDAFAGLVAQNRKLRLLLAGDGEDLEKLKRQAARLGVADSIHFLGRRPDIAAVLSASDVYAAPSRWEGLGIALGEAMLAGVPCAGTSIPGHLDILKDGVTGIAVPPEDPSALAAGIARLLDDPAEAAKLAAAAGELVRTGFSVESMVKKYEKFYLELAGEARP